MGNPIEFVALIIGPASGQNQFHIDGFRKIFDFDCHFSSQALKQHFIIFYENFLYTVVS